MKLRSLLFLSAVLIMAMSIQTQAQRGQMRDTQQGVCNYIPDLNEEQETKIGALRLERIAARTTHRAEMDELRARKRSLSIADSPDMNALNDVIDQMTDLRAQHLKDNEAHRQAVREILSPEQRTYFDSRRGQQGPGKGMFRQGDNRRGEFRGEGRRGGGRRF